MMETADTQDVYFEEKHHIGMITLNRPKALNALSYDMFKAMRSKLNHWKQCDDVHAVVIQAVPGKVFCAGGDVRWVYDLGQKHPEKAMDLFWEEYQLNHLTAMLGKPYISLMDGLTIGGGVGITLHGSHRVASEQFQFAMPETSIGLYPDIGSSHLLAHLPNGLGIYLGMTGARIQAQDAKSLGLVDYVIESTKHADILHALLDADLSQDAAQRITNILKKLSMPGSKPLSSFEDINWIDTVFSNASTVESIWHQLELLDNTWAHQTLTALQSSSPMSLKITFEQFRRAQGLNLAECLEMDYGLTYHFLKSHDFYEGVRARLVDKDKKPIWAHDNFHRITDDMVQSYFNQPNQDIIKPLRLSLQAVSVT